MKNRYAPRVNQNLFFLVLFFFVILLMVFLGISHSYYKNKQIEFYQISLEELSRKISFDLKLNNLFNIKKELAGSYVARSSEKILVKDEFGEVAFLFPDNTSKDACDSEMLTANINYDGKKIGVIESCYTLEVFQGYLPICIFTGLISLIVFFIVRVWYSVNTSGLMNLMNELDLLDLSSAVKEQKILKVKDENLLPVVNKLNDLLLKMKDLYIHEEHGRIVRQLKHDIRSPLMVLSTIIDGSQELSTNEKHILSMAVQRISKILSDLNKDAVVTDSKEAPRDAVFLEYALSNLVSDKKVEYQERSNLKIEFKVIGRKFSYLRTDEATFYRAFSNLINNAVEAIDNNQGQITVLLTEEDTGTTIEVLDNGPGINQEKISQVFEVGYTTKPYGTGLGLPQAKNFVENAKGSIEIASTQKGSRIIIRFPAEKHPSIAHDLPIKEGKVVVIDDDASIHNLWKSKLVETSLSVEFYLEPYSVPFLDQNSVWIIDHDFGPGKMKGLDFIIKSFTNKQNVYLSTNNFTEAALLDACEKNGVKIIPKFLLPTLSVKILK